MQLKDQLSSLETSRRLKELADHFNSVMGFARSLDGRFWEGNPAYWDKLIKTPSDLVTKALSSSAQVVENYNKEVLGE